MGTEKRARTPSILVSPEHFCQAGVQPLLPATTEIRQGISQYRIQNTAHVKLWCCGCSRRLGPSAVENLRSRFTSPAVTFLLSSGFWHSLIAAIERRVALAQCPAHGMSHLDLYLNHQLPLKEKCSHTCVKETMLDHRNNAFQCDDGSVQRRDRGVVIFIMTNRRSRSPPCCCNLSIHVQ